MKLRYVKTSNHDRFMGGIKAVKARGSKEACILLLTGEPGTGKSCTMDHWGAAEDALYIEGEPGQDLRYIRSYLSDQTGVTGRDKFEMSKLLVAHLEKSRQPIILDEAQHGLPKKAETIEYLRRIAERADVPLILVCHTSERNNFSGERLAHISTRISAVVELRRATAEDCALYLSQVCEVAVDAAVAGEVHAQSDGRYRLMANACVTLEALATMHGKPALTLADLTLDGKRIRLCEDAMATLSKKGVRRG